MINILFLPIGSKQYIGCQKAAKIKKKKKKENTYAAFQAKFASIGIKFSFIHLVNVLLFSCVFFEQICNLTLKVVRLFAFWDWDCNVFI